MDSVKLMAVKGLGKMYVTLKGRLSDMELPHTPCPSDPRRGVGKFNQTLKDCIRAHLAEGYVLHSTYSHPTALPNNAVLLYRHCPA